MNSPSEIRLARKARVRMIRRRVVAGAVALFVAAWLLIAVVLVSGHDPALASKAAAVATTGSSASPTTSSSGSSSSGSSSTGSSGSSSTNSGSSVGSVTTQQS